MKRLLSIVLCAALILSMVPVQAFASDEWTITNGTIITNADLPDNDTLYAGYLNQLYYGGTSSFGIAAGARLTGDEKVLYDALVPFIRQIASGERGSAIVSIGQEYIDTDGTVYAVDKEVTFTESEMNEASLGRVLDALLADLPYEMYWYDKVTGSEFFEICGSTMIQICVMFTVAGNYCADDTFSINSEMASLAVASVKNAQSIIDTYASESDYDKLVGYKDEICALVTYDSVAAAENNFSTDNDPWQLIHVFDGDSTTNVVCEGYSKAFMYLCDKTVFSGDVVCYTVMGTLNGAEHMWNIVSIDGKHYFADVTNSDAGTAGESGSLFLSGVTGSAAEGYTVSGIRYVYDDDTAGLWGTDEDSILNLQNTAYDPDAQDDVERIDSGSCGDNLSWTLDVEGTLIISGEGEMDDWSLLTHNTPWYDYINSIFTVKIKEGVTYIGESAFASCSKLSNVELPESLTSIGVYAFHGCALLESIYIPSGVTQIGTYAFSSTDNLTCIEVSEENTAFSSLDGILYDKNQQTLLACPGGKTEVDIAQTVTTIYTAAFSNCGKIKEIVIADGITELNEHAFSGCTSLISIEIPESVSRIGNSAFSLCSSLCHILFSGTQAQWSSISMEEPQIPSEAVITYNYISGAGIHDYNAVITIPTCTTAGYTTYTCSCGESYTDDFVDAFGHTWKEATCKNAKTCFACGAVEGSATGHNWDNGKVTKEPAVGIEGIRTFTCSECGETKTETIHALPEDVCKHTSTKLVHQKDATCAATGYTGDKVCTSCGETTEKGTPIEKTAHIQVTDKAVAATCTAEGKTEGKHCDLCQVILKAQQTIAAIGHSWSEWEVTTPATGASMGEEKRLCETCGLEENRSIDKLTHPFVDVAPGKFYETPILWAVGNGITNGMDETHFTPDQTCNRAQVVTFLWRAAGTPEPISNVNPFVDVKTGSFYYKAVLWAVENGITNGTSDSTFSPTDNCTRGQVATFLWRTLNNPSASSQNNPFRDVQKGRFYYDAVLWAVDAGVTNGMDKSHFAPDNSCTRGQIVTFLYRALCK